MNLLTVHNPKTIKSMHRGYLTFILHLAPATLSGHQVCPKSSAGCRAACLNTAGRGAMGSVQYARERKTRLFFENREEFMRLLMHDVQHGINGALNWNLVPVFRLNGTSDIAWEKIRTATARNIMEDFPAITFYDYTKIAARRNLPSNYSLTFSRSENNALDVALAFHNGMNVAAVFEKALPEEYMGRKVINGDADDLRFLDPPNVWVGLKAKGKAKKDNSGFTIKEGCHA